MEQEKMSTQLMKVSDSLRFLSRIIADGTDAEVLWQSGEKYGLSNILEGLANDVSTINESL